MPIKPIFKNGHVMCYEITASENIEGMRYQRKRRFKCSLPEAKKRELDLIEDLRKEANQAMRPTFGAWLDQWFKTAALTRKKSTLDAYRSTIETNVPLLIMNKLLVDITPNDIHKTIFSTESNISLKTRENLLQYLKVILKAALFERLITFNPADSIKISVPEPKLEAWTLGEVNRFLEEAKKLDHPWFPIWTLTVFAGFRSGEAYALTWDNVDLENRRLYVVSNWTIKDGYHETKNRRNRVVPINSELLAFLIELKSLRANEKYVLPHLDAWTKGYQAQVLRTFAVQIGLRQINFHALRASFITICMLHNVPTVKVQAMVGHQRMDTTMRYVRLIGSDLDGATENVGMKIPKQEVFANVIDMNSRRK